MTARTKYLFKDRADAEAAYRAERDSHHRSNLAVTYLVLGQVKWFRGRRVKGCRYDVGVAGTNRSDGGLAILVFRRHDRPQLPICSVFSRDAFRELRRKYAPPMDAEQRAMVEVFDKALAEFRD